jgi:hypothetical protein
MSDIDNSQILSAMRTMAFERALGELNSMLQTYYSGHDGDKFKEMQAAIDEFREKVIGYALHE